MEESRGKTNNTRFDNSTYDPGGGRFKRFCWYFINVLFFINPLNPSRRLKVWLLRLFGASVGHGVIIKPGVNIKYPWRLKVGNHAWIGERVWIDNLADVIIGDHCCLSQGALLLTGNHDYSSISFDLITGPIILEAGVWIGAKSVVGPGVTGGTHAVLSLNSVATKDLEPYTIYIGHPAKDYKNRQIS